MQLINNSIEISESAAEQRQEMLQRNTLIMSSGQKVLNRPSTINQAQTQDSGQGQGGNVHSRNSMIQRSYKQSSLMSDDHKSITSPPETKGEQHRLQSR